MTVVLDAPWYSSNDCDFVLYWWIYSVTSHLHILDIGKNVNRKNDLKYRGNYSILTSLALKN